MSNPHDLSDGRAVTHDPYVPALDGLRGLAALLVAGAHYMTMEGGAPLSEIVQTLTGLGMTLFFVLSGFVIHYNASALKRLGLQSPDIAIGWVTWAGALILLVLVSGASYALIEHPARLRIRAWFATQRLPQSAGRDGRV